MTTMLKTIVTAIALLATAAPAFAGAREAAPQVRVSYADLDLRRPADVKTLDRRIRAAVDAVCPEDLTTGSRLGNAATRQCRTAAFAALAKQRDAALAAAAAPVRLAANPTTR
jgi:UrcA family protein